MDGIIIAGIAAVLLLLMICCVILYFMIVAENEPEIQPPIPIVKPNNKPGKPKNIIYKYSPINSVLHSPIF